MQHLVYPLRRLAAGRGIADVALDEAPARPGTGADLFAHLLEVAAVAGGEVVKAGDAMTGAQQRLDEVGADEAGRAGDEPVLRRDGGEPCCGVRVGAGSHEAKENPVVQTPR